MPGLKGGGSVNANFYNHFYVDTRVSGSWVLSSHALALLRRDLPVHMYVWRARILGQTEGGNGVHGVGFAEMNRTGDGYFWGVGRVSRGGLDECEVKRSEAWGVCFLSVRAFLPFAALNATVEAQAPLFVELPYPTLPKSE